MDSYRVQYAYFVDEGNPEYKARWNRLRNVLKLYSPDDKAVQAVNTDVPFSFVGADLRTEPLVITVPEVEKDRYYSIQFVDMYTYILGYVGTRATGNSAGRFLLAGPNWKGEIPPGINQVLRSETEFAFFQYRTQLKGPADLENVKRVQDGYKVQPLSAYLGQPAPKAAPPVAFPKPLSSEDERTSLEFFSLLDFLLRFCPVHPSEMELRARFARIGIGAHKPLKIEALSPEMREAMSAGMADAWSAYDEAKKTLVDTGKLTTGDVFGTREYLKNNYFYRMMGAVLGIYGNPKEESIYPSYFVDSDGKPLDGKNRYALRFAPGQLPPVGAFWSVTLYELPSILLVRNPIDRYSINSTRLPELKKDADGGLTLYLQHESPGKEKEANWLPTPNGPFEATMRLYLPKPEALDGRWKAPPLVKSGDSVSPTEPERVMQATPVTADNFVRAESDLYFGNIVKRGGFGRFDHNRDLAAVDDHQLVVRSNRDTLYSGAVFDLDAGPVTITMPDAGKRFMSMQVIDQDQYTHLVAYKPGSYTLTKEKIGTRYVIIFVRTFVDPNNPEDVRRVHALQDALTTDQPGGPGKFEVPNWDKSSQDKVRDALLVLASTLSDQRRMYGSKSEVDPVRFVIGAAMGWAGNPDKDAVYLIGAPAKNDGKTVHELVVDGVPVDGFWSISLYNEKGYFEQNQYDAYSFNNITAKKSADGSIRIQFGRCDGKVPNCLPIMKGWNYIVRLYRPRPEVLDGSWSFPPAHAVE